MATQAWQMPDVDAEKYQSVTKQGGARIIGKTKCERYKKRNAIIRV